MKKNKISFETRFWAGFTTKNPFEAFDAIFDFAHLDYYKQNLSEILLHCYNGKVYKKEYPGRVFVFYTILRSFLKACFCLQYKGKKWKVKEVSDCKSILHRASLTKEEYANPFTVFQTAFAEKSLDEFDFFLCEIIHISLSPNVVEFDYDLITPYIHLIKMLDA
ncbi:MAG: hypothetical protein WA749_05210, partial [Gelidibacter sp.]